MCGKCKAQVFTPRQVHKLENKIGLCILVDILKDSVKKNIPEAYNGIGFVAYILYCCDLLGIS